MSTLGRHRVELDTWTNRDAAAARSMAPEGQRAVSESTVRLFRTLWDAGRWYPSIGAPMCWMEDGSFGNGNHRAEMISRLPDGVSVPVLVAYNVEADALNYMDTGKNRTLGHQLHYAFPDQSDSLCATAAAIASIGMTYDGHTLPTMDKKPDAHEAVEWALEHGERLFTAASESRRIVQLEGDRAGGVMTARTLGFVLYAINRPDAVTFFADLAARRWPDEFDPRSRMTDFYGRTRNAFPVGAQGREATLKRIGELFGCWDAHLRDIRWRPWNGEARTFHHPTQARARRAA